MCKWQQNERKKRNKLSKTMRDNLKVLHFAVKQIIHWKRYTFNMNQMNWTNYLWIHIFLSSFHRSIGSFIHSRTTKKQKRLSSKTTQIWIRNRNYINVISITSYLRMFIIIVYCLFVMLTDWFINEKKKETLIPFWMDSFWNRKWSRRVSISHIQVQVAKPINIEMEKKQNYNDTAISSCINRNLWFISGCRWPIVYECVCKKKKKTISPKWCWNYFLIHFIRKTTNSLSNLITKLSDIEPIDCEIVCVFFSLHFMEWQIGRNCVSRI